MKKIEKIYKPVGLTPLQAVELFRKNNPSYKDVKLSYMGRLDPMAEGEMLILIGDENKNRDKYLNLDKEYVFDVLFGLETDTFDILGKVTSLSIASRSFGSEADKGATRFEARLTSEVKKIKGKHTQEYPPYSSPKVKGKKLFEWAREGRLEEIDLPTKEIEIYDIKILNFYTISKKDLQKTVFERINLVEGDFRQDEILKLWKEKLGRCKNKESRVTKIFLRCSSGTYARSVANELGKKLGTGAIALNIKRTKI